MKDIKEVITSKKWHEFHKRSRAPFFSQHILGSTGIQKEGLPFDHRVKDVGTFCDHVAISNDEKLLLRKKTLDYLKDHPSFLLDLMEQAYREHTEKKAAWKERDQKDVSQLSSEKFSYEFQQYIKDLQSFGVYVTLPLFVEDYFEALLKEEFQKRFEEKADYWFGVAVDPIKNGTVLEEEICRLQMMATGKVSEENIKEHVAKFNWMANAGFFEEYYDTDHYQKLINDFSENPTEKLTHLLTQRTNHAQEFEKLLELLSDDPYLVSITKSANEAVFFRSYRTEMFYSSPAYNQNFFREATKRLGLSSTQELFWFYAAEITKALQDKESLDVSIIPARKSGYVFLSDYDAVFHEWSGAQAQSVCEAYLSTQESQAEEKEIKGNGAFPGKVSGKVVVLDGVKDLGKVKGGEVLVTHATNVNLVPALKKVIAIVTEEGGILSHAAIISRELRIPCVIGTKIATRVLKDGDMVEVDADRGIVRKL